MASDRQPRRSRSLRRCASFLRCFSFREKCEPVTSVQEALFAADKPRRTVLQLGSKAPKKAFPSACASKVKDACEQAMDAAKKGSPYISELFAGGQLFVQVSPPKLGPKPQRSPVSPSIGFLHMATSRSMDHSLPDR